VNAAGVQGGDRVADHRPCGSCGYDLVGLPVAGECPECGRAVADSLRGMLLRYAAPAYVRALRRGFSWVLNAILLYSVLMMVGVGVGIVGWRTACSLLLTGGGLAASVMYFVGVMWLTTRDPQFSFGPRPDRARAVLRGSIVTIMAVWLGSVGLTVVASITGVSPRRSGLDAVQWLFGLTGLAAFAVHFFAMMRYILWLAGRVPDEVAASRAREYTWGLPLLLFGSVVAVILTAFVAGPCALIPLLAGPIAVLVMYWNLLTRMLEHLVRIERTSERLDGRRADGRLSGSAASVRWENED
jgi:hypothetical protein